VTCPVAVVTFAKWLDTCQQLAPCATERIQYACWSEPLWLPKWSDHDQGETSIALQSLSSSRTMGLAKYDWNDFQTDSIDRAATSSTMRQGEAATR
jgi:hypothetical protein